MEDNLKNNIKKHLKAFVKTMIIYSITVLLLSAIISNFIEVNRILTMAFSVLAMKFSEVIGDIVEMILETKNTFKNNNKLVKVIKYIVLFLIFIPLVILICFIF